MGSIESLVGKLAGCTGCRQDTCPIAKNFLDQFSQNFTSTCASKRLASRSGSADVAQALGQSWRFVKFAGILSAFCFNSVVME